MPEKSYSGIAIFTGSQILQPGIGIPASGLVRYRWSRISPALPSYKDRQKHKEDMMSFY
jgi:hypothetical protein